MSQSVNVNFKLDADVKKKHGTGVFGIRSFYECSVHRFCKKSRQRKAYSF